MVPDKDLVKALLHEARREQSQNELDKLVSSLQKWIEDQVERDRADLRRSGRQKTRLALLKSVLIGAATELQALLSQIDIGSQRDTGAVFQECREYDKAIVWLERFWFYYRDKLEQRLDRQRVGPLLEAADEVVWSCYRQIWSKAGLRLGQKQGPPPLPYIAQDYSPAAWQSDKASPSELILDGRVDGLDEYVRNLPIPIVRLPSWCIDSPWWLIFVAHETGHCIQHELGLVKTFQDKLGELGKQLSYNAGQIDYWKLWGEEIFADIFSVMMCGSWALRAIRDFEWMSVDKMTQRRGNVYPPPVIRLKIMLGLIEDLGLGDSTVLGELDLGSFSAPSSNNTQDDQMVAGIVALARQPLTDRLGTLEELCGLTDTTVKNQLIDSTIPGLAKEIQIRQAQRDPTLLLPRLVVDGSLYAWNQAILTSFQGTNEVRRNQRSEQLALLAKNTIVTLQLSGPPGDRSGDAEAVPMQDKGKELLSILLKAAQI